MVISNHPNRKPLIAGLACWAGFAVIAMLVQHGQLAAFDRAGLLIWRGGETLSPDGPPKLAEMVRDITALGGVLLRNLIALAAVTALLFMNRQRQAMVLTLTVVGGWILNSALKGLFARPRPEIVPHLMEAGGASFPSGHSFNGAVVWIAVTLVFAAHAARPSTRAAIVGSGIIVSAAIAWSRVWLGVHYPSDVIAGWLGGAGLALVAVAFSQPGR